MSEKIIAVRNKAEVKAEEIYPGVLQRTLLKKNESASKKLAVSNLEIQPYSDYGPIEYEGEIFYYVLNGRGNLNYAGGHFHRKPIPLSVGLFDWESDSYAYLSPGRSHGILNQGEASLIVLKIEYDSPREPSDLTPWGVQIHKRDSPIRIDKTAHGLSIVNQTPDTLRPIGAKNFQTMEYEVITKAEDQDPKPKTAVPNPSKSTPNPSKPTSETVNYVVRGRGKWLIDEKEYPAKAGTIIYSSGVGAKLIDIDDLTLDYLMYFIKI